MNNQYAPQVRFFGFFLVENFDREKRRHVIPKVLFCSQVFFFPTVYHTEQVIACFLRQCYSKHGLGYNTYLGTHVFGWMTGACAPRGHLEICPVSYHAVEGSCNTDETYIPRYIYTRYVCPTC